MLIQCVSHSKAIAISFYRKVIVVCDISTEEQRKIFSKKSAVGEAVIKMHPARAGKHCFSFWCSVIQTCDLIKVRTLLIIHECTQSQQGKEKIFTRETSKSKTLLISVYLERSEGTIS